MRIIKKILIVFLIIITVLTMLFILPKPKYDNENVWLKANNNDRVLVMAHAGGKGVYPSNTRSAFDYSYNLGVDVLEMDVQMTKDKVLVLRHGENITGNISKMSNCDTVVWKENYNYLHDTCNFGYNFQDENGNYPYRDMTSDEWINAGVYLTTLEELFVAYGDNILYTIEIKADADSWRTETADELYKLIDKYDLFNNVLVATNYTDISEYILSTYPNIVLSTSYDEAQKMIIGSYTFSSIFYQPRTYAALQIPISSSVPVINELNLATKLLIKTAHQHNMAVHYWTINDEDEMRKLIELGCDGIITDYPEVLMAILDEYN